MQWVHGDPDIADFYITLNQRRGFERAAHKLYMVFSFRILFRKATLDFESKTGEGYVGTSALEKNI